MTRPFCMRCGLFVQRLGRWVAHSLPLPAAAEHQPVPVVLLFARRFLRVLLAGRRVADLRVQLARW